jgi:hypothetical protein
MESLWLKAHHVILDMKVGDMFSSGGRTIMCMKRTPQRIYLSNGNCITIKHSDNFYYLSGKHVNQILRDIEGFLAYKIHS